MDSPEGEKLTQQREMLIKGHVACLNYALKFGYVYKRWYTIVHGILKKDIGTETKIHRIRRITLFEWDYNLLLSIKSRQLLHQCRDSSIAWDLPFSLYFNISNLKHYTFLCKYTKEQLTLTRTYSTQYTITQLNSSSNNKRNSHSNTLN